MVTLDNLLDSRTIPYLKMLLLNDTDVNNHKLVYIYHFSQINTLWLILALMCELMTVLKTRIYQCNIMNLLANRVMEKIFKKSRFYCWHLLTRLLILSLGHWFFLFLSSVSIWKFTCQKSLTITFNCQALRSISRK